MRLFNKDDSVPRFANALSKYRQATFNHGAAAALSLLLNIDTGVGGEPNPGPLNNEAREWARRLLRALENDADRMLASERRQNDV